MATNVGAPVAEQGLAAQIGADLWWLVTGAGKLANVALSLMLFRYAYEDINSNSRRRKYEGHGYLVWAIALWAFAIPEVKGFLSDKQGGIPTLSSTVGSLINLHNWMSVFVVFLLFGGVVQVV